MDKLSGQVRLRQRMPLDIEQIIVMVKLAIVNEIHNIRNIIYDAQNWQNVTSFGIVDINNQCCIYMGSEWVTDIISVLTFLEYLLKER